MVRWYKIDGVIENQNIETHTLEILIKYDKQEMKYE
jgi:hypothetical protein